MKPRSHSVGRFLVSLGLSLACGGGPKTAAVSSVQIQSTNATPFVGETTHVGATPVDAAGLPVQGVSCAFVSSSSAVATVDPANGSVVALSPGVATITASCGGKQASIQITVRPREVTLTVLKAGNGAGAVFVDPPGSPTWVPGTTVTVTATANSGSAFVGWQGACSGPATSCSLVLDRDQTVTATFDLSETFVSGTWSAGLGSVTDTIGCRYAISASGVMTLQVVESGGAVLGTGSTTAHIGIVTTYTPPYDTCTARPFDITGAGNLSGSDAALTAALASSGGSFNFSFSGVRSGTTITGSASVHETLKDGAGNSYPVSGTTASFTATRQ